jgi:hypothetical protein
LIGKAAPQSSPVAAQSHRFEPGAAGEARQRLHDRDRAAAQMDNFIYIRTVHLMRPKSATR